MIVADANLLINYVCATPFSDLARRVKAHDPDWVSPHLWKAEVLNGLLIMQRAGLLSLDRAILAFHNAAAATVVGVHGDDPDAILSAAHASKLTAYDATYVVLARSLRFLLITEDKQILRACPDVARSMRQFLSPPQPPPAVREKPGTYLSDFDKTVKRLTPAKKGARK